MDNKNMCENVEIAIYSDTELSQEMKNHIENCESCKALLSQITLMKKELCSMQIPGIEDGKIACAVMSEIRNKKVSASLPKFKLTHHLGTAAAIVIILAAALMIKNPSGTDDYNQNNKENNAEIVYNDAGPHYHVLSNTADTAITAQKQDSATGSVSEEEDNADVTEYKVMMKGARTQSAPSESETAEEEVAESSELENENAVLMYSANTVSADYFSIYDEDVDALLSDSAKEEEYIFSGLDFKDGDENFDYNISLINKRLFSLYGDKYVLSESKLRKKGVDNEKLLNIVPTVTEKMFDFYKGTLDIFE